MIRPCGCSTQIASGWVVGNRTGSFDLPGQTETRGKIDLFERETVQSIEEYHYIVSYLSRYDSRGRLTGPER
jgi:hypothetical protein